MSKHENSIRFASRIRRAMNLVAKIARGVAGEIQRLNSARLDSAMLARMTRRERARLVKSTLSDHHRHPNRCC
jgi:hypothetical protein